MKVRDIKGVVFAQVSYLSEDVKENLYKRGLWEDLRQECELIALEVLKLGIEDYITARRYAQKRLYQFLRSYGYRKFRRYKWKYIQEEEYILSSIWKILR